MYTQQNKCAGDAYIPSNYRGNALLFEKLPCEGEDEPNKSEVKCEGKCEQSCECKAPSGEVHEGLLSSVFGKLLSGDNIIILALLAFFLFSSKDKSEDNTVLLLLLLLLF